MNVTPLPYRKLWRRTLVWGGLAWTLAAVLLLLSLLATPALAQGMAGKRFDHLATGFALSGAHANERCESCHLNGQFKGTPRDCASCHTTGTPWARANVVKTAQHVATTQRCDACHSTRSFVGARFDHANAAGAPCASCHNGATASAKPASHLPTSAACDSCHTTNTWLGARPDHSAFGPASDCSSCHNGSAARGRPANHIPVGSVACGSCHGVNSWRPSSWNHTQTVVVAQCAACHSGAFPPADGRPANHVPYGQVSGLAGANCDSCHKAGFGSWSAARVHANFPVTVQCATCHNGNFGGAVGKPATPIHTGVSTCETCHTTNTWQGAKVDHAAFNQATDCASCHNNKTAPGKPATHVPVGNTGCFSCHSVNGWKPTKWNHSQVVVTAQCAACHTGSFPPADGRPANHLPYGQVSATASANCDSCHKAGFSTWASAKVHANVGISSQCATCHSGGFPDAVGKPATPIHSGAVACENCHNTSGWAGAKVNHANYGQGTNCASCHNGSGATGKPGNHVPVGVANCYACHSTSAWKPSKWNHTQVVVTAQCAACHTGTYPPADAKPANHVPYTLIPVAAGANCDSCHKAGFTTWNPGRFHANYSVATLCSSCHTGNYLGAVGKPATPTHANVGSCEGCHNTSSWTGAKVNHANYGQGTNCASCHNGTGATGKAANHVPVGSTNCFSCHSVNGWKPTKWNHTQVVVQAQCASCHTGAYAPADGKPANHVPYQLISVSASANCDSCHKTGYGSWNPGRFHAYYSPASQCSTCHTGGYLNAVGKPANPVHTGQTVCESCHKSTSNWQTVQYQHAPKDQVGSGTCDTCHNGVTAKGKVPGHVPVQAPAAKCDSCHKSQVSFGTSVTTNHSVLGTQTCKSCHIPTYASQGADAKPGNHIPEGQLLNGNAMDCNSCHSGTSTWGTVRMNHNSSMGGGAGWCKSCHASGTNYAGNMERKTLNHEAKGKTPIDCSESGCHRPLGSKGKTYVEWD